MVAAVGGCRTEKAWVCSWAEQLGRAGHARTTGHATSPAAAQGTQPDIATTLTVRSAVEMRLACPSCWAAGLHSIPFRRGKQAAVSVLNAHLAAPCRGPERERTHAGHPPCTVTREVSVVIQPKELQAGECTGAAPLVWQRPAERLPRKVQLGKRPAQRGTLQGFVQAR